MPSVAVCPNADVPVDLLKTLIGFESELEAITFLVEQYLGKAAGRIEAGARLKSVEEAMRKGKVFCINEFFGD